MILVTGGAGFIGANFILDWLKNSDESIVNLDKLTYAGNPDNLSSLRGDERYIFVHGNICDRTLVSSLLDTHRPRAIVHFAAESHVDRSIHAPADFVETNVNGTFNLLEAARAYYVRLGDTERASFRFLHVSTDEVYGSLGPLDAPFAESSIYAPNSPYAASKAAADHFVRAYHHTYGLPTLTTNCSNNYGPYHFPEKLIPLVIANALSGKSLPVYGDGKNVRDWLYVDDHCVALRRVLEAGIPGETYNIGGWSEKTNLDVVHTICDILDQLVPKPSSYRDQLAFVPDRLGHDRRYAINARKIERELGWKPAETFDSGIRKTVQWYLDHPDWVRNAQAREQSGGRQEAL
ncbi:MAG TPA: dTDP-glucose 4,6-dehydratase [Noviherbaspirillum sp.]|nr:dTDP-glucose 4,6-dehydratase [Noviherbaspirillum sp.]